MSEEATCHDAAYCPRRLSRCEPSGFAPRLRCRSRDHSRGGPPLPGVWGNGKLRDELLNGEIFYTLKEAQVLIEWWREEYNEIRPHSALGYPPPAPVARLASKAGSATLRLPWEALATTAGLT